MSDTQTERDGAKGVGVVDAEIRALLERSRRLGGDRRLTNYGGGNTSCKVHAVDEVTGHDVHVLWVKGSGGDLGTLTLDGLAALRIDWVRALCDRYRAGRSEEDLFPLLEECRFGRGGRPPSIEAPLHALLPATHIDHLHPDAVVALAIAADGAQLVERCYGGEVGWIPWTRPGFELALRALDLVERSAVRGIVLGGHGLLTWGETSEDCEASSRELVERADRFIAEHGRSRPFGPFVREGVALPESERRARAAALAPTIRGLCSTDGVRIGHFSDPPEVLEFLASERASELASRGTSCPDHYLRTRVRPLVLDVGAAEPVERQQARLRELHAEYRREYSAYYREHADESSPPMRGADPTVVLLPGVGIWSFGPDASSARIAGEFYQHAVRGIAGAEALSRYVPIETAERFAIEYWWLEEAKLRRLPPPRPLTGKVALVVGGASGIGRAVAQRLRAEGAAVVVADIDAEGASAVASELDGAESVLGLRMDVEREEDVRQALTSTCLAFGGVDIVVHSAGISLSRSLLETPLREWKRMHGVFAQGSFLIARESARVMIEQGRGGDLVFIVSKNAVAASKSNLAYGSAKASQAHQVRLLAVDLGEYGIRVNGINPDGVVEGSRIFSGEWGEQRAATHGVSREKLGAFYASRTLLKKEVLPTDVASAVFAFVAGDLRKTTGAIIPVDSGVPAAFLR